MASLIELPVEMIAMIVIYLTKRGVLSLSLTCRYLRSVSHLAHWRVNAKELMCMPPKLHRRIRTLDLDKKVNTGPPSGAVFTLLRESLSAFRNIRVLHIDRNWARDDDSNYLISRLSLVSLHLHNYGQKMPTSWPTTLRTLVIRDIFADHVGGNLENLHTLDCAGTRVLSITGVGHRLKELYARGSRLTEVPPCTNLRCLDISYTPIKRVPCLPYLTRLYVNHSRVRQIPNTLSQLVYLDISGTSISRIPPNSKLVVIREQECENLKNVPNHSVLRRATTFPSPNDKTAKSRAGIRSKNARKSR
jgi:Leucine-rich repeat (LRR) protein